MASYAECLIQARDKYQNSGKREKQLAKDVERLKKVLESTGDADAQLQAKAEIIAIDERVQALRKKKQQAVQQATALQRTKDAALGHQDGAGVGMMRVLEAVESSANAVRGIAHAKWAEAIQALRTTRLGWAQDTALLEQFERSALGMDASAEGKQLAGAWADTAAYLKDRFNRAGGDVKTLWDWSFPQTNDRAKIKAAGFNAWRDWVFPRVDRQRMLNFDGSVMDDKELSEALEGMYRAVITENASLGRGPSAIKNRHLDPRFLKLKQEHRIDYRKQFGSDDLFGALMSHIDTLSREIALMEHLGPNSRSTFDAVVPEVAKVGYGGRGMIGKLPDDMKLSFLDSVYADVSGEAHQAASRTVAQIGSGLRHWMTSAMLGAAQLSSFGDLGTAQIAASYNGLRVSRVMGEFMRQLKPGNEADRLFAMKLGVAADVAGARLRYGGLLDPSTFSKLSETVLRASGLSHWTESLKRGFSVAFMGDLGELAGRSFADADGALNGALSRYGFTAKDWSDLSAVRLDEYRGGKWMSVPNIMEHEGLDLARREDLTDKLLTMITEETRQAVPEPGAKSRALLRGGLQRGTVSGEFFQTAILFKAFAAQMALGPMTRALRAPTTGAKVKAMGTLVGTLTLYGMASLQAKRISKGQDMADMSDPTVWGAAMMQGGGLGLAGDLLVTLGQGDRFGRSFVTSQMGPGIGFVDDTVKLLAGTSSMAQGSKEPGKFGAEAIRYVSRYTPGSSLWYARRALWMTLEEQAAQWVDPAGARRANIAKERWQRESFGAGYFWRPGQATPDRLPKVGQ